MGEDRRYYGLDALRGGMMLLGIVLHSATLYLAAPPPHLPVATDANQSLAMDVISAFIHAFRMPTFFLLAGFFTALLVEKRGVMGMYRNRLARIAAPFAAGMFTILPLTLLFLLDFAISVRYGKHNLLPEMGDVQRLERETRDLGIPQGLPVMHLWFLLYLGYFYLLVPFCRMLVRWSLPFEGPLGRFLASPYSLPVFALWTAATLWPYPGAMVLGDFIFLGLSPPAFFYYGTFFVIGYIYHHYRAATARLVDYLPACVVLACVLFPLSLYATHAEYTSPTAGMGDHLLTVVVHAFCTWALVWAFVGLALRYFDRPTPWALYASQSAYWVYLLHLPVVGLVGWLLVPVDVHAVVKFTIVGAVTTVVCFVTYHYGVQNTWLGNFLHGRRFQLDWPWRGGRAI